MFQIFVNPDVFPIIQMNLIPVFVDIDPDTLNMDINDLRQKITPDVEYCCSTYIRQLYEYE